MQALIEFYVIKARKMILEKSAGEFFTALFCFLLLGPGANKKNVHLFVMSGEIKVPIEEVQ